MYAYCMFFPAATTLGYPGSTRQAPWRVKMEDESCCCFACLHRVKQLALMRHLRTSRAESCIWMRVTCNDMSIQKYAYTKCCKSCYCLTFALEHRTRLGITKVELRGSWGFHHCRTDRGPPWNDTQKRFAMYKILSVTSLCIYHIIYLFSIVHRLYICRRLTVPKWVKVTPRVGWPLV